MRMIFVNLPVKSVAASRQFFGALGFGFNEQFSDENTTCMVIEENIFAMLMEHVRFQDFITGEISDATKATEVLTCLSADSRAQVDDTLAKALAAGGKSWKPILDMGPMYGCSFQDLDGHVWELMYMDQAAMAEMEAAQAS
ncbi:glyoxalase [Phenylobacterium sp. Root77]|uniref:VOC family protein n=1 Tax=unclassified Phenylobacterium TaxID=2640670 RepID=UPI0006FBBDD2|nr:MULTISPECIES: VOC family protein [unclassified Phenylobacterium]KQW72204.1 glyoxalase [Phenylobacterium sp. Root1277]KQW95124.1 glyoxalase [Phenylobacterium sp. Root1290]KRC44817.1 glyoxalase [Phenylobacterium sp. Root77]